MALVRAGRGSDKQPFRPEPHSHHPGARAGAVSVRNLTKDFGPFRAVDDVSFDAATGATVAGFIGANGSGKTTTMRMMLGLTPPTSGTALFDGVPYQDLGNPRATVGAVVDADSRRTGQRSRPGWDSLVASQDPSLGRRGPGGDCLDTPTG